MDCRKKKNGKIELFRFIFTMMVVWYHGQKHFFKVDASSIHMAFCYRGRLGVEFFFIVSGYLMASSVYSRLQKREAYDLGVETAAFAWHKMRAILPYHIVSFAILFLAWMVEKPRSLKDIFIQLIYVFPGFTLIEKSGFNYGNINRVEWYISAMIFAILILYPVCRRYYSMFVHVIAPAGGLLALGYLYQTYGAFTKIQSWTGLVCAGVVRAMAEISLGTVSFECSKYLREKTYSTAKRVGFTLAEWMCWGISLLFMMCTMPVKYEIFALAVIFSAVTLTFSGQGYGNAWFDNSFFYWLGSFSLSIYLSQVLPLDMVEKYCVNWGAWDKLAAMTAATLFNASVCYGIVWAHRNISPGHRIG